MKTAGIMNRPNRRLRLAILVPAWVLLVTIAPVPPLPPLAPAADTYVTATPVALDEDDPGRRRLGPLLFLRGWELDSPDLRFGGISSMQLEGDVVTAISDSGTLLRFPLPRWEGRRPLRVERLPLAGTSKHMHDSEALLIADGRAWIALERQNAIMRFRRSDWRHESVARPRPMRRWPWQTGPEAMVRLPDGRFLVFAEGRTGDAHSPVVLFDGDPAEPATGWQVLRYRRAPGYRPTEAALLPDGRILVLNRRFDWFQGISASLVIVDPARLEAGRTLAGETIAELAPPLTVDNMEAMTVTREGGRTIVRIASDDNFMNLQRTLLLEFALEAPARD